MSFENVYQNKFVIIRSYDSGVHFGKVVSYDSTTRHVKLADTRRLWKWRGFTLSSVANDGMYDDQAKLDQKVDEMVVANVIELIPCTEKAIENMTNYPVYNPYKENESTWE